MSRPLSVADRNRLSQHSLFTKLTPAHRSQLLQSTRVRSWAAGGVVLKEGDASDGLFVILAGQARVTVEIGGRSIELARLREGGVFGERGLLYHDERSASVSASSPLRCAVIPAALLRKFLAANSSARTELQELSAHHLRERLTRTVDALRGLNLEGTFDADVSHEQFAPGEHLLTRGDPPCAVYFVLSGVVLAVRDDASGSSVLAGVGPGHCVGELGVLSGRPRAASVVAETDVTALRVEPERFRAWARDNPSFADYLGALERVYPFADGQRLSVYRGIVGGKQTISTVLGDPLGACVVSTKTIGEEFVALVRGTGEHEGERARVSFESGDKKRVLLLDRVALSKGGTAGSSRVVGVEAHGVGADLPVLYARLRNQRPLSRREIVRFRRTGHIGGQSKAKDPQHVCACLGIGWQEVETVRPQCGNDPKAFASALGIGSVCGACLPTFEAALQAEPSADLARSSNAPASTRLEGTGILPRWPDLEFDRAALTDLSAEPQAHLVTVASIFATVGERFMVRHIGDALPNLRDRNLIADARAFIAQERNHIEGHAELNRLYLEEVYPDSRALRRLSAGMLSWTRRLPRPVALAVCAAFEHSADGAFEVFFEEYYAHGRRFSLDPETHALIERSGAGRLMHWHGCEELEHRHVAFDVMQASGASVLARWLGFAVFLLHLVYLLLPALAGLRLASRGRRRPSTTRSRGVRVVLATVWHALRFLSPRFHPSSRTHPFADELAEDRMRYPSA